MPSKPRIRSDESSSLDLKRLGDGSTHHLTKAQGQILAEAAAFCLGSHKHPILCPLEVTGEYEGVFELRRLEVDAGIQRTYADLQEATEHGACGIAILLIRKLTDYNVVERSWKGTGFDYWLARRDDESLSLHARLEVSGILKGDESRIKSKTKEKLRQTEQSDHTGLPAYVVIVEFSKPRAVMVRK